MVGCLILAAGSSTRMGRTKQLLDLGGLPVIRHVCDAALRASVDDVVVVLGHDAEAVLAALPEADPRLRTVRNDRYREGQSTSFVAGIRAMPPKAAAALVLLGDQPEIRTEAIDAVVRRWRSAGGRVVQAAYRGSAAHPMLFDRSAWPELERATGDEGGRGVIADHPGWRTMVEVGGRPPRDIDTAEDYERIRTGFGGGAGGPAH